MKTLEFPFSFLIAKTLKVLKTTAEVAKLLFIEAISDRTDNDNESAHFVGVEKH